MPDGRGRARPRQRGFPPIAGRRWTFRGKLDPDAASTGTAVAAPGATGRPSVRRTTSITSSTYSSALPCSAAVRTQPPTWSSRTHDRQRIDGGPQRGGLLQDVDAVLLALDHPGDAADLALHPRQAPDQLGLVLRVAVAEMARVGCGRSVRRASVGLIGGQDPRCVAPDAAPACRHHTPWGYPSGLRVASGRAPVDWPPMGPRDLPAHSPTVPCAPPAEPRPDRADPDPRPSATTSPSSSSTAAPAGARRSALLMDAADEPDARTDPRRRRRSGAARRRQPRRDRPAPISHGRRARPSATTSAPGTATSSAGSTPLEDSGRPGSAVDR